MEERQKKRHDSNKGTPEHVKRILAADEAQLNVLTSERNKLFVKKSNDKYTPKVSTKLTTPQRGQAMSELNRSKNVDINFKDVALQRVE